MPRSANEHALYTSLGKVAWPQVWQSKVPINEKNKTICRKKKKKEWHTLNHPMLRAEYAGLNSLQTLQWPLSAYSNRETRNLNEMWLETPVMAMKNKNIFTHKHWYTRAVLQIPAHPLCYVSCSPAPLTFFSQIEANCSCSTSVCQGKQEKLTLQGGQNNLPSIRIPMGSVLVEYSRSAYKEYFTQWTALNNTTEPR